jgi:chromosome segregation ATPase
MLLQTPGVFNISSHPIWGDQAAVAQAKLGPAYPWFQPSQPIHQVPEYVQLNYQLLVAQAEQQRVQKDLDTMTRRNTALTARCSQLESQLQASQAAERSSSAAAAAAADKQLEGMRQQLEEANRFLDQQQKTNKQQAEQLQQALGELAAERKKAAEATAAAESFEQELKQIKVQLVASQEQEGVLLAGVQRLTTAGTQNQAALAAAEGQVAALAAEGNNLQQQLASLQQEHQQLQQQYKEMKETNVNVTRALLLLTEQQEEAVTTAQQLQAEVQQLKPQLAAVTAEAAAANAAKQAALRDAAATLAAMTHFDVMICQLKREHAAAQEKAVMCKEHMLQVMRLRCDAPAKNNELREQIKLLEWKVFAAETLKVVAEVNGRFKCDQAYAKLRRMCDSRNECEAELQRSIGAKGKLQEQVDLLKSALQQLPGGSEKLQALFGDENAAQPPKKQHRLRWLWGWAVR